MSCRERTSIRDTAFVSGGMAPREAVEKYLAQDEAMRPEGRDTTTRKLGRRASPVSVSSDGVGFLLDRDGANLHWRSRLLSRSGLPSALRFTRSVQRRGRSRDRVVSWSWSAPPFGATTGSGNAKREPTPERGSICTSRLLTGAGCRIGSLGQGEAARGQMTGVRAMTAAGSVSA
jgi:hypothetical protein